MFTSLSELCFHYGMLIIQCFRGGTYICITCRMTNELRGKTNVKKTSLFLMIISLNFHIRQFEFKIIYNFTSIGAYMRLSNAVLQISIFLFFCVVSLQSKCDYVSPCHPISATFLSPIRHQFTEDVQICGCLPPPFYFRYIL